MRFTIKVTGRNDKEVTLNTFQAESMGEALLILDKAWHQLTLEKTKDIVKIELSEVL